MHNRITQVTLLFAVFLLFLAFPVNANTCKQDDGKKDSMEKQGAPSESDAIPDVEQSPESIVLVSVTAETEEEERAMFPGLTTRAEREMAVAIMQVRLSVRKYILEHTSTVLILRVETPDGCYGFCHATEGLEEPVPPDSKEPDRPRQIKPMLRPEFEKFAQALQ